MVKSFLTCRKHYRLPTLSVFEAVSTGRELVRTKDGVFVFKASNQPFIRDGEIHCITRGIFVAFHNRSQCPLGNNPVAEVCLDLHRCFDLIVEFDFHRYFQLTVHQGCDRVSFKLSAMPLASGVAHRLVYPKHGSRDFVPDFCLHKASQVTNIRSGDNHILALIADGGCLCCQNHIPIQ